jgi:hypothetical protein
MGEKCQHGGPENPHPCPYPATEFIYCWLCPYHAKKLEFLTKQEETTDLLDLSEL